MSSIDATRNDLENAVAAYSSCKSSIVKILISSAWVSQQTLNSHQEKLEDTLQNLNRSHTLWVSRSEFSAKQLAAEKYSQEWLENEWDQCFLIENKIDLMLSAFSSTHLALTNKQTLQQHCAQMESFKSDMTSAVRRLSQLSIPLLHDDFFELSSNIKDRLNGEFRDLMNKILSLDLENFEWRLHDLEQFYREQMKAIFEIELDYADFLSNIQPFPCGSTILNISESKAKVSQVADNSVSQLADQSVSQVADYSVSQVADNSVLQVADNSV